MNINCMQQKIGAGGKLKLTILQAIVNLYQRGNHQMSAEIVKAECYLLNNGHSWAERIPAICNSMRRSCDCGGRIIGEDRNFNGFTIAFLGDGIKQVPSISQIPLRKTKPTKVAIKRTEQIKSDQPKLVLSKNFKVVMTCSSGKVPNSELLYNGNEMKFKAESDPQNNQFLPDDTVPGIKKTWRKWIEENQGAISKMAYQLYSNDNYTQLYTTYGKSFYILSAGWGLVNSEFKLPKYDVTFSQGANIPADTHRVYNNPVYQDFNDLVSINHDDDIIYIGGKDYLNLFMTLTQNLPNRKIIYYNANNHPDPINDTFVFRRYVPDNPKQKTNWHYGLAQKIANGIIP